MRVVKSGQVFCGAYILGDNRTPTGHDAEQPAVADSVLSRLVGLDDLQSCFPASATLWFCDIVPYEAQQDQIFIRSVPFIIKHCNME